MSTTIKLKVQPTNDLDSLTLQDILPNESLENMSGYLRVSLLEECNERCYFCHNEGYKDSRTRLIREDILKRSVDSALKLGSRKFKFTGGEPTLDSRLPEFIRYIRSKSEEANIGIVTNATSLESQAEELYCAGLNSIIVSLHSVDSRTYRKITALDALPEVVRGLARAREVGFDDITINSVIGRMNFHEIPELSSFASKNDYKIRFLDILPTHPNMEKVRVSPSEIAEAYPGTVIKPKVFHEKCSGCESAPICGEGDYLRLSAQGSLDPCMYRPDLRQWLHPFDSDDTFLKKVALGFRRITRDDI